MLNILLILKYFKFVESIMYTEASFIFLGILFGAQAQRPDPCCFPDRWEGLVHHELRFQEKEAPTLGYRSVSFQLNSFYNA